MLSNGSSASDRRVKEFPTATSPMILRKLLEDE